MTFENKFQTNLFDNFIKSLTTLTYSTIILLLTILSYIGFSVFGTMTENGKQKIIGIIVVLVILTILTSLWKALSILPNEKSVSIENGSVVITFPYFKKSQQIKFQDINYIRAKNKHKNSESVISIKTNDNFVGLNEDFITINSISSDDWRVIAKERNLPLIIHNDIEERVITKKGLFGTSFHNADNYYVIQKDFEDERKKLELEKWQDYVRQNNWIKELGQEELINVTEDIQKLPKYQYSLDTKYGLKGIDYVEGQLIATYDKDENPVEIERIANDLELDFKNVMDLK
jgi:hypothetical protein